VDAGNTLPHIPQTQFPAVSLANMVYLEGGIRSVEIGSLMFEHVDPVTGIHILPPLELVRFAIPRRVYTRSHLDYIGEAARIIVKKAEEIRGLKIVSAPKLLRHFLAELEWLD
jgi:tryptophanase